MVLVKSGGQAISAALSTLMQASSFRDRRGGERAGREVQIDHGGVFRRMGHAGVVAVGDQHLSFMPALRQRGEQRRVGDGGFNHKAIPE